MNDNKYEIAAQLRGERTGEFPSLRDKLREIDKEEPKDAGVHLATNYGFKITASKTLAQRLAYAKAKKRARNARKSAQRVQRRAA